MREEGGQEREKLPWVATIALLSWGRRPRRSLACCGSPSCRLRDTDWRAIGATRRQFELQLSHLCFVISVMKNHTRRGDPKRQKYGGALVSTNGDHEAVMNDWLSDDQVFADLRGILESGDSVIEFDEGAIAVDHNCICEIVSKHLMCRRFDHAFGSCFAVLVAVGGVRDIQHGVVEPRHCFATLWYTLKKELITTDFSKAMPR